MYSFTKIDTPALISAILSFKAQNFHKDHF